MATDWVGLWFKVAREAGEFTGIRLGRRAPGATAIEWTYLPHEQFDGVGGFAHQLRLAGRGQGFGSADAPMPVNMPVMARETAKPAWRERAAASLRFARRPVVRSAGWRRASDAVADWAPIVGQDERARSTACAAVSLSVAETEAVRARARREGVSINTWLLHALAQAMAGYIEAEGPRMWMIPVNMRGPVRVEPDTANHASFIEVRLDPGATARDLHAQVRGALSRREHWGTWHTLNLGRWFGEGAVRRVYRHDLKSGRSWTGTLSNLGEWTGLGEGGEWFFCPPVGRTCPFGTGAVICDGRLSLTLQVHPGIACGAGWAKMRLVDWVRGLSA